ncbi:putative RNA helicase [Giardia duodenalis assemblage B]|uniref:Putative RNA helicase n=1 Tax=Giardia duodenalis assemblage B TaxID=1394984 RepID=A0A132NZT4_GIAIN|nr:putative RNA helicase [Giardia intestinalis assemblage B]
MPPQSAIQNEQRALPIYPIKNQLIDSIINSPHRVVVVVGSTGSGKSTQLPQYLIDAKTSIKRVTVTQPRRVAAISLALRVAQERGTPLGQEVGYSVRFDAKVSESTRIRYATDGIVIREALLDPLFRSDSIVIVDEAHERSVSTDLLLGFLKTALDRNAKLRVVIMSATIAAASFVRYFGAHAANTILSIRGRQYPIKHYFTLEAVKSYQEACVSTVLTICKDCKSGDILVFMPGELEIRNVVSAVNNHCAKFSVLYESDGTDTTRKSTFDDSDDAEDDDQQPAFLFCNKDTMRSPGGVTVKLPSDASLIEVLPFYANLSTAEQMKVFSSKADNVRRVIVATNIAETSITVPNIRYVVDCGFMRKKQFHHTTGTSELITLPCSQASILQRAGRAGRLMEGECYHIYTHETYANLEPQDIPEIMLTDLMPVFLTMIAFGITNPVTYEFITDPPRQAKKAAIVKLSRMGCIQVKRSENGDDGQSAEPQLILSRLGKEVVRFPTDPELAISILTAHKFGKRIVKDVVGVAALLSCDGVFVSSADIEMRDQSAIARTQFYSVKGDHITLLNIWKAYCEESENKRAWCAKYYLSHKSLEYAKSIYRQLMDIYTAYCKASRKEADTESLSGDIHIEMDDEDKVIFCVLKGYISNVAKISSDRRTYEGPSGECRIHPASCIKHNPECVLYHEIVMTSFAYMRTVSEINPAWIEMTI